MSILFSLSAMEQKTVPGVKQSNCQNLSKGSVRSFSSLVEQTLNKEDQSRWFAIFSPIIGDLVGQKELLKLEALSAILAKEILTPATAQQFFDCLQKLFKDNESLFSQPVAIKTKEFYEKLARILDVVARSTLPTERSSSLNEPGPSRTQPTQTKPDNPLKQPVNKPEDSPNTTPPSKDLADVDKLRAELEALRHADVVRKAKKEAKRKSSIEYARKELQEAETNCQRLREAYNEVFQAYIAEDYSTKKAKEFSSTEKAISQNEVIDSALTAVAYARGQESMLAHKLISAFLSYGTAIKEKHEALQKLCSREKKESALQSNIPTQEQNEQMAREKMELLKAQISVLKIQKSAASGQDILREYRNINDFKLKITEYLETFEDEMHEFFNNSYGTAIATYYKFKIESVDKQTEREKEALNSRKRELTDWLKNNKLPAEELERAKSSAETKLALEEARIDAAHAKGKKEAADAAAEQERLLKEGRAKSFEEARQRTRTEVERRRDAVQRPDLAHPDPEKAYIKTLRYIYAINSEVKRKISQFSETAKNNCSSTFASIDTVYLAYFEAALELENLKIALSRLQNLSLLFSLELEESNTQAISATTEGIMKRLEQEVRNMQLRDVEINTLRLCKHCPQIVQNLTQQ